MVDLCGGGCVSAVMQFWLCVGGVMQFGIGSGLRGLVSGLRTGEDNQPNCPALIGLQ